jgi:hypothetical protein
MLKSPSPSRASLVRHSLYKLNNRVYNDKKKWNKKNMKECDKRKGRISTKLHMIYISSNNVRHPVTKTFTTLHPTTLHVTSLHLSTLPLI